MAYENGEWIMHGIPDSDPRCIKSVDALVGYINKVGFLPLFANEIKGFSVEEITNPRFWWTDNVERDPWQWREIISQSGKVAYGKFFDKKAGFISLSWFPAFANMRRDGYDFDALWEDQKATAREKKIMDLFMSGEELFSFEMRRKAGFNKDGEKNFEGVITSLMMKTYLVLRDFRCRKNRFGIEYGWPIAVYATPESRWGYELISGGYNEAPEESKHRIISHLRKLYPDASEKQIEKLMR